MRKKYHGDSTSGFHNFTVSLMIFGSVLKAKGSGFTWLWENLNFHLKKSKFVAIMIVKKNLKMWPACTLKIKKTEDRQALSNVLLLEKLMTFKPVS